MLRSLFVAEAISIAGVLIFMVLRFPPLGTFGDITPVLFLMLMFSFLALFVGIFESKWLQNWGDIRKTSGKVFVAGGVVCCSTMINLVLLYASDKYIKLLIFLIAIIVIVYAFIISFSVVLNGKRKKFINGIISSFSFLITVGINFGIIYCFSKLIV